MSVTQKELASISGTTPTFISNVVSGLKEPSMNVAKIIAVRLGVTVDELLIKTEETA